MAAHKITSKVSPDPVLDTLDSVRDENLFIKILTWQVSQFPE